MAVVQYASCAQVEQVDKVVTFRLQGQLLLGRKANGSLTELLRLSDEIPIRDTET